MTCTADPDYIRAISVRYRRCPSSYSVRSAVVRTGFELPARDRPKTAISMVPPAARPRTAQAQREKTQLLEELMFFYGRGVHEKFRFPRQSISPERSMTTMTTAGGAAAGQRVSRETTSGTTFITEQTTLDRSPNTNVTVSSVWSCQNEALRQMFKTSKRRPRHRFFPQVTSSMFKSCDRTAL